MHVSDNGVVTRSLVACYWADEYAAYCDHGGMIIARLRDGYSIFIQPGDDTAILDRALIDACDRAAEISPGNDQAEIEAIDRALGEYDDFPSGRVWSSPARAGGRPSRDGGLFNFYR